MLAIVVTLIVILSGPARLKWWLFVVCSAVETPRDVTVVAVGVAVTRRIPDLLAVGVALVCDIILRMLLVSARLWTASVRWLVRAGSERRCGLRRRFVCKRL